jgi:lysophospholipase L1-like esterase
MAVGPNSAQAARDLGAIMPVGDSITAGYSGDPNVLDAGWRGLLYNSLTAAGYAFQYVGTANVNPGRLPTTPIDQTWHDSGTTETWRTLAVRDFIGSWLTTLAASGKTPAIIAMMTGTNDINDNNAPASVSNVSVIIDTVHARTPATKLFVAKIVPVFTPDNAWVAAYNAGLATLVGEKQALGYNVAMVDLYTGFPFAAGMDSPPPNSVHPNAAGYAWLAQQWHTALTTPVTTLNSNGNAFAGGGWDHSLPAPGTDGVIGGNGNCGAFDISTPFDIAKDGLAVTVAHTAGAITSGGGPGDWAAKNSGTAFYYWRQSGGSLSVPRSIVMGDHLHYTLSNTGTLGATQQTGGVVTPVGSGTFTQTGGTVTNLGYRAGNGSTLSLSGGAGSNIGWARGTAYGLANNAAARIDISGNYAATIDTSINAASVVGFDSAGTGGFVLETTWTGSLTRDNFTKADWITALAKTGVMVGTTQVTSGNFDTLLEVRNAGAPGSRVSLAGPPPPVTVTWGTAHNITGDSDVLKTGTLVYAYAFGNAGATVNTVPFTLGNVDGGGTDVTFGYASASYSGAYFGPDAGLSTAYNTILTGANWTYTAFPLTLNHLTPGINYTVQVWSNNNNPNTGTTDYTSLDGAVHLLGKMAGNGDRGQYATGTFTASGTSQVIAVGGTPQELINALQVRTAPDPGIPTISITSPTDGATVAAGTDITITAAAADDGTITRVSFYDGTTQLGADVTTAPYTHVWHGAATGDHVLTAKVWDNTGLSATSAEVKVKVTANTTPAGVITWGAAQNVTAASDVLNTGTALYAYAFGTDVGAQTVNTVAFAVGNGSGGGTDVTISGAGLSCGSYFPLSSPPGYNGILKGAVFGNTNTGPSLTVTLNHLVAGQAYAVQVWSGNVDYGGSDTTYDGAVSLAMRPSGQYAIGTFTAAATGTQAMILTGGNYQINAVQVRTAPIPAGYEAWAGPAGYNLTAGAADRGADPDGDGFTNIQEFLFGTSPIAGNGALVNSGTVGGTLVLHWLQRETGSTYLLEESTTMGVGSWSTSAVVPVPDNQTGAPANYDRYKATIPIGPARKFFRVKGTEN